MGRPEVYLEALALPLRAQLDPHAALLDNRRDPPAAAGERHLGVALDRFLPLLAPPRGRRLRGPEPVRPRRALVNEGLRRELVASDVVQSKRRELARVFNRQPEIPALPAGGLGEPYPDAEVERGNEGLDHTRAPSTGGPTLGGVGRRRANLNSRAHSQRVSRNVLRRRGARLHALRRGERRARDGGSSPRTVGRRRGRRQRGRCLPRAHELRLERHERLRSVGDFVRLVRLEPRAKVELVAATALEPPVTFRGGHEHLRDVQHLAPLRVGLRGWGRVHGDVVRAGRDG